jgi:hypothetical protein
VTEPIAGAQPEPQESVLLPRSRPSRRRSGSAVLGGFETFALPGDQPLGPLRDDGLIGTSVRRTGARRDVECRDRTAKTPQLKVSELLQSRNRFHRASDAAADQDLPVPRLGTQPRGEIAHRADGGVAGAVGKPNLAQCGVTPSIAPDRTSERFRCR